MGQHVSNMLEDKPGKKMEEWSRRFAQAELGPTNRSNQAMQRTASIARSVVFACLPSTLRLRGESLTGLAVADLVSR